MDNTMNLALDGETFETLRTNFDIILQRLLRNMQDTKEDEGKLTVNIEVKLDTEFIPEYKDGKQNGGRDIKKPTFKHKVTSAIAVKDEKTGAKSTEMELVWNEESMTYVIKPILGREQMSIDDYMEQKEQDGKKNNKNNVKAIETHAPQIAGPTSDDDVIDGDYREIDVANDEEPTADVTEQDTGDTGCEDTIDNGEDTVGEETFEYDDPESDEGEEQEEE